ncbi:uncharacterized protein ACNLHF_005746 [Anomaloglossus baeobatrachus]
MPGITRRATQAIVPTQLQLTGENRQYLSPEGEQGQYGRPDVLPRTPPVDEAASDSLATSLSTSSLGSGGQNSPARRAVGVEVHKSSEYEVNTRESTAASRTDPGGEEEDEEPALDASQIETEICF